MNIALEIAEPALIDLMSGRSSAVTGKDSRGTTYSLQLKSVQKTTAPDQRAQYLAKALDATDADLQRGYTLLAEKTANPVLGQLKGLSESQLRDVIHAALELLPSNNNSESAPVNSTAYTN